jgi:transcription antitermination protein NusB
MNAASGDRSGGPAQDSGKRSANSAARLAAVQALYQMSMTGHGADAVVREFRLHRLGQQIDEPTAAAADPAMFAELVRGVAENSDELDDMLAAVLSEDLDIDRLETVLKIVLRAGAFELSARLDVPARVAINEYVDVADAFYARKETALVNAVLDRLARSLRPDELEGHPGESASLTG